MYDPEITHWEIKTAVAVGPRWFRVNTIKLLNGKFETAVMDSDPECRIPTMIIYFYNSHTTEQEATEFNATISKKMSELNSRFNFNEELDPIFVIQENIKELNRYTKSVPYQYPEDLFGESYR